MKLGLAGCLLAAGHACMPLEAAAQCVPAAPGDPDPCPLDSPHWVGHFTALSANAMIGGLTAGLFQVARGGSFARGFTQGMLGGSIVYTGKYVAAQRFSGAGFVGREVAAIGSSVVRNAVAGHGAFDELILPVGIVRVYVRPADPAAMRARLDLSAAAWTIYGIAERELRLDAGASLSAGTPVFRTRGKILRLGDEDASAAGLTNAGVIYLADVPAYGTSFTRRSLAHERVHVIQMDQVFVHWTGPAEDWLLGRVPGGETAARIIDVNLAAPLLRLLGRFFTEHGDRPWELEAIFMAR